MVIIVDNNSLVVYVIPTSPNIIIRSYFVVLHVSQNTLILVTYYFI